jgi:hypothetical protein
LNFLRARRMDMKRPSRDPGPRIFIASLKSCEIVYLPESGQIVSLFAARRPQPADDGRIRAVSSSQEEEDGFEE